MFRLIKKSEGYLPATEYLDATASESFTDGELLILSSGALTACTSTSTPEYISLETKTIGTTAGPLYVMPIEKNAVYSTKATVALTSVALGSKVTLASATGVTATTTSGVAKIVYKAGNAIGDEVHVKF